MPLILTINAGSSSVKFQCFEMEGGVRPQSEDQDAKQLAGGQIDRLGSLHPNLFYERHDRATVQINLPRSDYGKIFHLILKTLLDPEKGVLSTLNEISAVGHRVVHGGSYFSESKVVTPEVEAAIHKCIPLAPLHNPYNLQGIQACREMLSNVPHIAVFDTAFHQTMPDYAYMYPLPYRLHEEYGIRRYGFHGTSHRYVSERAAEITKRPLETLKLISCHLGNGCSVTAIDQGKSVDTSMGLTPLEGLMMGTRCGDIDPAIIFHLSENHDMSLDEIAEMLNRESGLLGISGISADVRDLFGTISEGNQQAMLALKMFCYRVSQYIGRYIATLGGLDALIFTAGIGENAPQIRAQICEKLRFMGIHLDEEKNRDAGIEQAIHRATSPVQILVIPTNEELIIARDTLDFVNCQTPYKRTSVVKGIPEMAQKIHPGDYPNLFAKVVMANGAVRGQFKVLQTNLEPKLISNVNLVPYIGEQWVVIQLSNQLWKMPGGTIEPGEDYLETLARELMEEAGAELVSHRPIGAWKFVSNLAEPYRPHLPHPISYRYVLLGEIELTGSPSNPEDGEEVVLVEAVDIDTAVSRFEGINRLDLADLYRLAHAVKT